MLLVFGWGYDAGLSGVAIAFPEFREVYGNYYAEGKQWVIPALWQSLWNAASTIGQVFGGMIMMGKTLPPSQTYADPSACRLCSGTICGHIRS
jgi:hypothetical protein